MPAVNPSGDAMSVVMCQFSPTPATDWDGVKSNIDRIFEYIDRACNSFPGVDLSSCRNTVPMDLGLTLTPST